MNDRLADLLRDPDVQRCLRIVDESDWTIDDLLSCYGPAEGEPQERGFEESDGLSDDVLYARLSAMHGHRPREEAQTDESVPDDVSSRTKTFGPPPEELIAVPKHLFQSINRTYAEVSRHGFLTERDFEERLYRGRVGLPKGRKSRRSALRDDRAAPVGTTEVDASDG